MSKPETRPALARITFIWYLLGFFASYFIISPSSILGYVGVIFLGFFLGNILPAFVAMLLNLIGINPATITNIGRFNEVNTFQHTREEKNDFYKQKYGE